MSTETDETLQGRMYYGWLNNLVMYSQQLEQLRGMVNGANYKNLQVDASIERDALKELISTQQTEVDDLIACIMKKRAQMQTVYASPKGIIPFAELIKTNELREKIRKSEQSVFYLRYQVNKLLSIAS